MKRQLNLSDFFNKKPKLESVVSELTLDGTKQSQAQPLEPEESSTSIIAVKNDNSKINEIQQASLRKKMKEKISSEAHNVDALQAKNIDIIKAEKLMIRSIKAFQTLGKEKGLYEKKVDELITSETFKNIKFVENQRFVGLPRERLLENITVNLGKKLIDCEHLKASCSQFPDSNILQFLKFLEPDYWNIEEVDVPWQAAEEQLHVFNDIFNDQIDINDYRDFVENVLKNSRNYDTPDSVQRAKNIIRTIAVSSAEVERVFSKMNIICSRKRTRLTVSNISNTMTISLIGLPPKEWDPTPTVKRWLRIHRSADDARVKVKKIAS
ncbi:E3 SUMO-protein ligase KIAA1586-like isoform X3 [Ahaetulla prasina]|uniref:E3 SUMO-protein ligase KIAA1586-like isoform X3 n=1 Tax=Ahaetulla prasina TaxID=499056 RepID=UPI00264725A7|nr:E3 SUMO-protein ligase KIAA1586-like isoform X3 [Ahaetulla prasina]